MPPKKIVVKKEMDELSEKMEVLAIKPKKRKLVVKEVVDDLAEEMEVLAIKPKKKKKLEEPSNIYLTEAEYIYESVKYWYKKNGLDIPETDKEWCEEFIKQEKKEAKEIQAFLDNPPPPKPEELPKPTFGSPEYWKDYWAKKKAAGYVTKKDAAKASKTKK